MVDAMVITVPPLAVMVVWLDDPYDTGSESTSSDPNQQCRHDRHAPQNQFEQSMITMNKSLVDLFHCQQQTLNETTHVLQAIQQSQKDRTNNSLINDIQTFDGKPELYFNWILK